MRRPHIRKDDTVIAVVGTSKGKTGKVLQVQPGAGRVLVEGLNVRKKTLRKSQDNPQGGITDRESPLTMSNVMLYCPECKKGVKIKRTRAEKSLARSCKLCGHSFEG